MYVKAGDVSGEDPTPFGLEDLLTDGVNGSAVGLEAGELTTAVGTNLAGLLTGIMTSSGEARAYLQYILFDESFAMVANGYIPIEAGAADPDQPYWKNLSLSDEVTEDGYLYAYVVNESTQDVFFDDFTVQVLGTRAIRKTDYYPFGAVAKVWNNPDQTQRETYRHGYQGQYSEQDTTTGWNAFELRMYDPLIGRWLQVDPMREFASPYNGMGNNPLLATDPTGGNTCCIDNPLSILAVKVANWWNNSTRVTYSSVELKGGVALAGAGEMTITGNAYDRHGQVFFEASPSLGDSRTDFAFGGGVGIEGGAFIVPNSNFMEALTEMSLSIEATAIDVMFIGESTVKGFGVNLGLSADAGFSSFGLGNNFSFIAFLDGELSITPMSGTWEARDLDGSLFLFMDDGYGNFQNTNINLIESGSGFMTEGFYDRFNEKN